MSRARTPFLTVTALGALLALGLSACAPAESAAPTDSTVVWAIEGGNVANGHLDPHSSQQDSSAYLQRNVFDSLLALDPDGEFHPWLAESWEVSEDGTRYTFQLRDDVDFHDGEHFDAEAAKVNFDHIVAEETASAQASSLLGGDLFLGAAVLGDYELELTLAAPFGPLLTNLSTAFIGFYSPAVLASATQEQLRAGGPGISVGTGPFVLTEYTANQQLVYTRNDDYDWAPEGWEHQGPAAAAEIVVRIVPEESGRVGAVSSGEAQVAVNLTPNGFNQFGDEVTVHRTESPGLPYSVILNWEHGVFSDLAVRQAFQQGFDLDAAVAGAFQGDYQRAWSVLSPSTPNAYDSSLEGSWSYDPDLANELLDGAGWTERDAEGYRVKDGERLSAEWLSWLPFADEKRALVNFMADDLKEIGFELKQEAIEGPQYQARYFTEEAGFILDFDATDWGFASIDADILRSHLHSEGYQNASRLADPEIDGLLEEAAASADPAERAALYAQIQEWNRDNVAIVPLYLPEFVTASAPTVSGLAYDAYGWPLFYGAAVSAP